MNAPRHSPGNLLANLYGSSVARLILLSGPSGSGKTTWCLQLNRIAAQRKILAQGLISLPVFRAGPKIGIDLLPLPGGISRCLAVRCQGETIGLLTGDWHFDECQMAWGEQHLAHLECPRLLIIDELGPLEFLHGQGWQAAFSLIEQRAYSLAVAVVRPALLSLAQARWPWAETLFLSPLVAVDEGLPECNDSR